MTKKFHLTDLLLVGVLAIALVFVSFIAVYGEKSGSFGFSPTIYTAAFIALVSLLGTYFFFEAKYNKVRINKFFAIGALLLIVENMIVVLVTPSTYSITTTVQVAGTVTDRVYEVLTHSGYTTIPNSLNVGQTFTILANLEPSYKWFAIFSLAAEIIVIYILMFIVPRKFGSVKFLDYLCYISFIIGFTMMVYSYIAEGSLYAEMIKNIFTGNGFSASKTIQSYTGQHNVYGMALLLILLFAMVYHSVHHKWWVYLIMVFIGVNLIFTTSKGSIIVGLIMAIGYFVIRIIFTYKEHQKRNTITLIAIGAVLLIGIALLILSITSNGAKLSFLYKAWNALIHLENNYTIQTRIRIWQNTIQLLNDRCGWVFGRGNVLLQRMLYPMNVLNSDPVIVPHNGVLRLIGYGGIPMLVCFILLVAYTVRRALKRFHENPTLTLICLVTAFGFVIYSVIESNHLMILGSLFPALVMDGYYQNKEDELLDTALSYNPYYNNSDTIKAMSFGFILIGGIIGGVTYPLMNHVSPLFVLVPVMYILLYFIVFLVIGMVKDKASFIESFKDISVNLVATALLTAFSLFFVYLFKDASVLSGFLVGFFLFLVVMDIYCSFNKLARETGELRNVMVRCNRAMDHFYHKVF